MTTTETRTTTETTTESRPTTTSPAPQAGTPGAQHVDVLIVGARGPGRGAAPPPPARRSHRATRPAGGARGAQRGGVRVGGAGVSGLGAAHTLRERFPDRSFAILDAQDNRGGTWWTHRYPGVRSDSDLFTYGYRHKPWRGPSIAAGGEILAYLAEGIEEDGLARHIRSLHRANAAAWSSDDRRWTVEVTRGDTGERL